MVKKNCEKSRKILKLSDVMVKRSKQKVKKPKNVEEVE